MGPGSVCMPTFETATPVCRLNVISALQLTCTKAWWVVAQSPVALDKLAWVTFHPRSHSAQLLVLVGEVSLDDFQS